MLKLIERIQPTDPELKCRLCTVNKIYCWILGLPIYLSCPFCYSIFFHSVNVQCHDSTNFPPCCMSYFAYGVVCVVNHKFFIVLSSQRGKMPCQKVCAKPVYASWMSFTASEKLASKQKQLQNQISRTNSLQHSHQNQRYIRLL